MNAPLVTLAPAIWSRLVVQATGHEREGGGLLIGRKARGGGIHVVEEVGLTHEEASEGHILYYFEELARARWAAHEAYGPQYGPVGRWHSHIWHACTANALMPQITTLEDSDDEYASSDIEVMLVGDIEVICATFPDPGYKPKVTSFDIRRKLGGVWCRAEAWLRVNGEAKPCRLCVRRVR